MPKVMERQPKRSTTTTHPLVTGTQRLKVWEQARGIWANRRPDPIKELAQIRKGWDRPRPTLKP